MFRKDRFRMKLNALDGYRAVPKRHDEAVRRLCGDLKTFGQTLPVDDQRMITPGSETVGKPFKDRSPVVPHGDGLSVHRHRRTHDLSAVELPDRLMPQADA